MCFFFILKIYKKLIQKKNLKIKEANVNPPFYERLYNASGIYCFLVLLYFIVITIISDFYILLMFKGLYDQNLF